MKYTFLLFALSMLVYHVQAQTTKLVLNPKELSMQTGETNTVSVQVENTDFDYQLFLSVAHSDLGSPADINFRTNPLNPPYVSSIDISIQGAPAPGRHQLVIKAANGPLAFYDTCYITIPEKDCEWERFAFTDLYSSDDHDIAIDSKNNAWIAPENQLTQYSSTGMKTDYQPNLGEMFQFEKIICDKDDNIWLSMKNYQSKPFGLLLWDQSQFIHFTSANSQLPNAQINAMACDHNNNIWIATDAGLVKYDRTFWTLYNTSNTLLSSDIVTEITTDKHGNIWIVCQKTSSQSEIFKYSGQAWLSYSGSDFCQSSPSSFMVNKIAIDSSDNIWLIMHSINYAILKADNESVSLFGNSKYLGNQANYKIISKNGCIETHQENVDIDFYRGKAIKANAENEIWYGGTNNEDTYVYHYKNNSWTVYSHWDSNLPSSEVSDLAIGSDNTIFVSSRMSYSPNEGPYLSILNCEEPIVTSYTSDARRSDAQISIYPNPVQNELFLSLQNLDLKPESIRVIDVHGNAIPAAITIQQGGFYEIDVEDLVSGIYHITFLSNGKIVSQRFVKM